MKNLNQLRRQLIAARLADDCRRVQSLARTIECHDSMRAYYPDDCRRVAVSVYAVTRRRGGPEEGGWYFNSFEHIFTHPGRVKARKALAIRRRLFLRFADQEHGDIYSSRGGREISVSADRWPGEQSAKHRPAYS